MKSAAKRAVLLAARQRAGKQWTGYAEPDYPMAVRIMGASREAAKAMWRRLVVAARGCA